MRSKDPKYRRREMILLVFAAAFLVALFAAWPDIDRRLLAWKVAHGRGGDEQVVELWERGAEMIPYIEAYLSDPDEGIVETALEAIAGIEGPDRLPLFRRMAASDRPRVRQYALDGLTAFTTSEVFGLLVAGLADPDPGVRKTSIRCLHELTGERRGYPGSGEGDGLEVGVENWGSWLQKRQAGPTAGQ